MQGLLQARGETVATAESLTGGRLAAQLTAVPGASATYRGGVVAYANEVKVDVLGVPAEVVAQHGAVSAQCACAMALGIVRLTGATWGIATTGVAGPDLQEGKPVGTVFLGLAGPGGVSAVPLRLAGDRSAIVEQTCRGALATLAATLATPGPEGGVISADPD